MPGEAGLGHPRVLGVPAQVRLADLGVLQGAAVDEPVPPRSTVGVAVEPERVEHLREHGRVDAVEQRAPRVGDLAGQPDGLQHAPRQAEEHLVAGVVDGVGGARPGAREQVDDGQRAVALLAGAQLGDRQVADGPDG